jgi:hypothetical protein
LKKKSQGLPWQHCPISGGASSESSFAELLLGALRVPDVAHGLFVRPALLPRLAQAARGRFARL